jgi:prolyl oligopeptidase
MTARCFFYLWLAITAASNVHSASMKYPSSVKTNQVDIYHGVSVSDPYRWLEDDNSDATKAWVEAQNKTTFGYLEKIPQRPLIHQRLTRLWNYERYSTPVKQGSRYFLSRNDGLQNQNVLYTLTSLTAEPRVLLDPNQLSADGTVALAGYAISDDGKFLAYGLASAGSDWQEWKVREVDSGSDRSDVIKWVKFSSASWSKDGSGFYYSRYDEPSDQAMLTKVNYFQKLYYHKLGTPQSDDRLVYHRPDQKEWGFGGLVTDDGAYLVITASQGTDPRNRVMYQDLKTPGAPVTELLMEFDASYNFVDNDGPVFWFLTDLDAPRGRLIAIDVRHPDRADWRELIPQNADALKEVSTVGNRFFCTYLKDAQSRIIIHALDGRDQGEVQLPSIGSAGGFGGKRADTETFYLFTSYTVPGTIYHYDISSGRSEVFRQPKVDFDSGAYETRQVFYASKDGARIPMFLTYRRDLKLNGHNPTLLYGYGGFNIPLTPAFGVTVAAWLELGGVYAVPNLRGGGEYGETWHQSGMKLKKQNVFDDLIAAAEWLIDQRYTSAKKLAISGGSNGGLLVGACMVQRPDLFGATLPAVGVMDMLRFNKFTIGWAWTSDYGSPENPEEFKALFAYSPLHNLKPGTRYPATLVTTADHDDRVVPAHSFKFAARLQECQAGPAPALIRVETKAGHGAGKPTSKQIEETTDRLAFLVKTLGMRPAVKTSSP